MADDNVNIKFGGEIGEATSAITQLREGLQGLTDPIRGIRANLGELAEAFVAAFAVEKIVDWVKEVTEAGAQVEHLKQQLGITAEQVSVFAFEANAMGVGTDGAAHALERLERNMVQAERGTGLAASAFRALNIDLFDGEQHLKSLDDILPEIADAFHGAADGPEKTAIAIALLGRAGAEMIPFLNKGREGLAEFKQMAEETGSVITNSMAEGMEKTSIESTVLSKAFQGMGLTLYEALKPEIDATILGVTDLVESFNNGMKDSELLRGVFTLLVGTIDGVVAAITILSATLQQLWQVFMGTVDVINVGARTIGEMLHDAFTGNFSAIETDFAAGMDRMVQIIEERGKKFAEAGAEAAAALKKEFSNLSGDDGMGEIEVTGKKLPAIDGGGNSSRLAEWRDELDQKLMAEKNYFGDSKTEELAFWQAKLGLTEAGSKEQLAVERNIYTLSRDIARQAATEKQQIARDDADTALQIGKIKLQAERDELDAEVDAHKITAQQKIAILKDLSAQEFQLDLNELQNELSGLAGQPAAYQKVYDQILVLKQKHVADMAALDRQAADVQKQQLTKMTSEWEQALSPLSSAFSGALRGMEQGTMSFRQAIASLGDGVVMSFIEMAEKSLFHWIASELAKTAATQTGVFARIAAWLFGDTTTAVESKAQGALQIGTAGAVTYANAFAALAAIPMIGPELAPAGAAAAEATMLSVALPQLSAADGAWSLPDDMTVRAHAKESILPAAIATPMRAFFENGGASNVVHKHFSPKIEAILNGELSAKAIKDFTESVVDALYDAHRNGAFT